MKGILLRAESITNSNSWRVFLLVAGCLAVSLLWPAAAECVRPESGLGQPDEDVPYGVASSWLVGRQLLVEGKVEDALPYLHFAYRAQPEVQAIAMTFQEALAAEGYLNDALEVMDSLIEAWPDSVSYLLRRSSLNLQAGKADLALTDLRRVRESGMSTPEVYSAEAALLAAEERTDDALAVYREALAKYPEQGARFYLGMAQALQHGGRTESIPSLMDEALDTIPDEPKLWLVKIRTLASQGEREAALEFARDADDHFGALASSHADTTDGTGETPVGESFLVELADYYAQHGQLDRSVGILLPLSENGELKLTPSLWLGRLLLGTGKREQASGLVDRILERWPESARGWFLRGKLEEAGGDWAAAIPHFREAVNFAPGDAEIRLGLVRAMLVAWERDLVRSAPETSRKPKQKDLRRQTTIAFTLVSEKDAEGQLVLGYAFYAFEHFERAAFCFEQAAEDSDLRLSALTQASLCLDEMGRTGKARQTLETLRREYADNPDVANSLGYFLAEKGEDLDLAEDLVREALETDPGNGAFLDSLGWVLYRQGRFQDALDYLIRAVNALPDDPVILEHLGLVLRDLGQTREALDILRRALDQGGDRGRLEPVIQSVEESLQQPEEEGR